LKITSCNSYSFPLNPLPTKPDPVMVIPLHPLQRAIFVTDTRTLSDSHTHTPLPPPHHPADTNRACQGEAEACWT